MASFWKSLMAGNNKFQDVSGSPHHAQRDQGLEPEPHDFSYHAQQGHGPELTPDDWSYAVQHDRGLELAPDDLPYPMQQDRAPKLTDDDWSYPKQDNPELELAPDDLPYPMHQDHGPEPAPELFILVTSTGAVLAVDSDSGRLHQVLLHDAEQTAIHAAFEGSQVVFYGSDAIEPLLSAQWEPSADGSIGIRQEGSGFLRSPPHLGPVEFGAEVLSDWERLLAVPVLEFEKLIVVSHARWVIDEEKTPTASGSMSLAADFGLTFHNRNCSLVAMLQVLREKVAHPGKTKLPESFMFFHDCSVPAYARLYRPLIYTTLGGSEHFFQQMSLLLASLENLGDYSGDYAIISDRSETSISQYLGGISHSRLSFMRVAYPDVSAIVSARRNIIADDIFSGYYPVLYLDSDIICTSPIEGLLVEALRSDKILIAAEFIGQSIADVGPPDGHWFGLSLYGPNDTRVQKHRCINSGIFSGRSQGTLQLPFRAIEQSWQNYKSVFGDWHRAAYDQPFFSLVLQCLDVVNVEVLESWVTILRGLEPDEDAATACLVHFNIGVGLDKTRSMKRFYDRLCGEIPHFDIQATGPQTAVIEVSLQEVE